MKFTVDYPIVTVGYHPALVTAAGMTRVAHAAEECGYDALSFSERPSRTSGSTRAATSRSTRPRPSRSAPPSPAASG